MEDYETFSSSVLQMTNLKLRGIMTIPNVGEFHDDAFSKMSDLYNKYDYLDTLSMGMSNDYVTAIENEANLLRIGQQIFGAREW